MKTKNLTINGSIQEFMITTKKHFIEMYCNPELDTVTYLDDSKEYLIMTVCSEDYFEEWCVSAEEIEYMYNPTTGAIEGLLVSAEDDPKEYCAKIEKYESFLANFAEYILYNPKADYSDFRIWQQFQKFVDAEDCDTRLDNKVCLVEWLGQNWGAWFDSVLDESFKYMNVTYLVHESFKEFCEEE